MSPLQRAADRAILEQLRMAARQREVPVPPSAQVAEYDWSRPYHFTQSEMARLTELAAPIADRLGRALAALLRTDVPFEAADVTECYAAAVRGDESDFYYVPLLDAAGVACGAVRLPVTVALAWVDKLLGMPESLEDGGRELSSLEVDLLIDLVAAAVQALAAVAKEAGGPVVHQGKELVSPQEALPGSDADEYCRFLFRQADEEARGEVAFFLRTEVLEPLVEADQPDQAAADPSQIRERLLAYVMGAPVTVTAQLGTARIPVRDLMSLEPGDVVPLNSRPGEVVRVTANGQVVLRGVPVACEGRYAVQVQDLRQYPRSRLRV